MVLMLMMMMMSRVWYVCDIETSTRTSFRPTMAVEPLKNYKKDAEIVHLIPLFSDSEIFS